jgi:hypothetical protein
MTGTLGILAYGSLIDDPGPELAAVVVRVIKEGVVTPFKVEFARTSATRAGAPTLVPVTTGGAHIPAQILVLRADIDESTAREILWRRETGRTGGALALGNQTPAGANRIIERLQDFHGISVVLYVRIGTNIARLTAQKLAELAIASVKFADLQEGRDGISYLAAALRNGVRTPLTGEFEQEIKRQTGAVSLAEALRTLRGARRRDR